jgi:hypothetical protein
MSRWSQEEDRYILEFIQEIQDEINYQELVSSHNKTFNTKRTEDTYKVRVRKIAKENNINLKSNNHWTEDEKTYIINNIQRNPFDINWTEMSEHLKRSELSIKTMYNDIVSARDHLECCLLNLDETDIRQLIESNKHTCSQCNMNMYSNPSIWQGFKYCDECYYKQYSDEVRKLWEQVREYSVKTNKNYCNICNKKATFDNTMASRFHYDHINMFDKTDSICKMVREGANIEDIYKEIDKCQLLCISCHSVVTKVEIMCGFIRIKRQMTKEFSETDDEEKRDKLINEYSELYNKFMSEAYNYIRCSI